MYIDHIAIWTNDLERLRDLYVRNFNCRAKGGLSHFAHQSGLTIRSSEIRGGGVFVVAEAVVRGEELGVRSEGEKVIQLRCNSW
jgi:catechol 2,3-dioxygenase-like lactoylglutathione lyase family enzyme